MDTNIVVIKIYIICIKEKEITSIVNEETEFNWACSPQTHNICHTKIYSLPS